MIRPIVHDPLFPARKFISAAEADGQIISNLQDTSRANLDRCVGIAANTIGERKRIIVFCNGPMQTLMVNSVITAKSVPYKAEEGCFSPAGAQGEALPYYHGEVSTIYTVKPA